MYIRQNGMFTTVRSLRKNIIELLIRLIYCVEFASYARSIF